jgi:phage shock protein E
MKFGFIALFWLIASSPAAGEQNSPDALWIDVRTAAEYESGHVPGARNIDFDRIGEHIAAVTQDKDQPIVLYCKSGRRSGFAKQTLVQLGYRNVHNAGGVVDVLRRAGNEPALGPDCVNREC